MIHIPHNKRADFEDQIVVTLSPDYKSAGMLRHCTWMLKSLKQVTQGMAYLSIPFI